MQRDERAARASAKAAQRIIALTDVGDLAECAAVAWRTLGFCERMGSAALARRWRGVCEELDGPGYADAARWRSDVQRVQAVADRELGAMRATRLAQAMHEQRAAQWGASHEA